MLEGYWKSFLNHYHNDKEDWHPDNIIVFSSHRAHVLYENYELRRQQGINHLFTIEEILTTRGEWLKD